MIKQTLLIFILMTFFSGFAVAGSNWSPTPGEVTAVYSHKGIHNIRTTLTDGTCSRTGEFYWSATSADAKDMFSLALAAFMGGKKIIMVDTGNTDDCSSWGASLGTHMSILNQE